MDMASEVSYTCRGGRVQVIKAENSYRGMKSVISLMSSTMRRYATGHPGPFGDGLLFDEYCVWSGGLGHHRPDPVFLMIDGVIEMLGDVNDLSFSLYDSLGENSPIIVTDMAKCGMLSEIEVIGLREFLIHRYDECGSVPLNMDQGDVKWLFKEARPVERRRVAMAELSSACAAVDYSNVLDNLGYDTSSDVRAAVALNSTTPPWTVMRLAGDHDWHVRQAVTRSYPTTANGVLPSSMMEIRKALLSDQEFEVRVRMAAEMVNRMDLCFLSSCFKRSDETLVNGMSDEIMSCDDDVIRGMMMMKLMEMA